MVYSDHLRSLRKDAGLSQVAFAKKFSIPTRTYEQWERGLRTPPVYVISMIEKILYYEEQSNENK